MSARCAIVRVEHSPNQDFSIRLQSHTQHVIAGAAAGIEGSVECPICVDARDASPCYVVVEKECTAEDDLAIRLEDDRIDELLKRTICARSCAGASVKSWIQTTRRKHVIRRRGSDVRKIYFRNNAIVRSTRASQRDVRVARAFANGEIA